MSRAKIINEMQNLQASRRGRTSLDMEELQALVMNLAYLEIATAMRKDIPFDIRKTYDEYERSALEAVPAYIEVVKDSRYPGVYFGFEATAKWDGLWNFLREYFESNLGINIDNEERIILRYDSTRHERYENDVLVTSSEALRKVVANLSKDKKRAHFTISEVLSNKEANLMSVIGNKYTYLGTDPDFKFEFTLDSFENIDYFALIRTDRNLRLEYFE
jgi:hypothetical protein